MIKSLKCNRKMQFFPPRAQQPQVSQGFLRRLHVRNKPSKNAIITDETENNLTTTLQKTSARKVVFDMSLPPVKYNDALKVRW